MLLSKIPEALQYVRLDNSCPFGQSFRDLKDAVAKARIDTAVRKLSRGLKPDVKSVGDGVHEACIDYGPGYRVYFGNDGGELVVLLLCGDKLVRPMVARGGMRLPFVWVLMGCIGGFGVLGLAGLAVGPVVLSLFGELRKQRAREAAG